MSLGNSFLSVDGLQLAAPQTALALKLIASLLFLYARSNYSYSFLQTPNTRKACFSRATNRRCGAGTCNTPNLLLALAMPDPPPPGLPLAGRLFLHLAGTEEWLTSS